MGRSLEVRHAGGGSTAIRRDARRPPSAYVARSLVNRATTARKETLMDLYVIVRRNGFTSAGRPQGRGRALDRRGRQARLRRALDPQLRRAGAGRRGRHVLHLRGRQPRGDPRPRGRRRSSRSTRSCRSPTPSSCGPIRWPRGSDPLPSAGRRSSSGGRRSGVVSLHQGPEDHPGCPERPRSGGSRRKPDDRARGADGLLAARIHPEVTEGGHRGDPGEGAERSR